MRFSPISHRSIHMEPYVLTVTLCTLLLACGQPKDPALDTQPLYAIVDLTLQTADNEQHIGHAVVEIVDETGHPAAGITVHGTFVGIETEPQTHVTDTNGIVHFRSSQFAPEGVLGFQVDAVSHSDDSSDGESVYPAVRIDSCALEMLAAFATEIGDHVPQHAPLSVLQTPRFDRDESPTVLLLDVVAGLQGKPMALAIDADRFYSSLPDAGAYQVISLRSEESRHVLALDAEWSFPTQLDRPDADACIDLLIRASTDGDAAKILPDPSGNCATLAQCEISEADLGALWSGFQSVIREQNRVVFTGIGTSPSELTGIGTSPVELTGIGTSPVELTGIGTSPGELTGIGTSPAELTGIGTSPGELTGIGTSPVELTGIGTSPVELTGIGTSPGELTGIGTSPVELTGIGTSPVELTGIGTSPVELTGIGTSPVELTGIGTSPVELTGIGTSPVELTGIGTSPVELTGIGTSPVELTGIGTSPGELTGIGTSPVKLTGIGTSP